jgi:hypothetical protein
LSAGVDQEYFNLIPQPLLHDIARGVVVPLIGSGFSRNAQGIEGGKMPLWKDLGEQFAKLLPKGFQYDNNPTNAISKYVEYYGKTSLVDHLKDFLYAKVAKPSESHRYFAQLPFDTIITTNFDNLLESAYKEGGIIPHVIHDAKYLPQYGGPDIKPKIIKIHGDLDHPDSIVITANDYKSAMKSDRGFSSTLKFLLSTRTFLFIGYSITDPDFTHFLKLIKRTFRELKRPAFALVVNPNEVEFGRYSELGIVPITLSANKEAYDSILSELLQQMALHFNLSKEQESPEVRDDLNTIQLLSTVESEEIKNKTFYNSLFEFVKEAASRISDIISAVKNAKRYDGDDSIKYFPLEQQFRIFETLEYLIEGSRLELEKLPSFAKCKEIMDQDLLIAKQVNTYHNLLGLIQRMSY